MTIPPIIDVAGVLISSDIITERFCCDLEHCKGACCVEGDAGAPVTLDEIGEIEDALDVVWDDMTASAQAVVDKQSVAYSDPEGELVTSIVNGKDCVFTYYDNLEISDARISHCCLCALEKAYRTGHSKFCKPISCALYPIRVANLSNGLVGLNYNQWSVCKCAREKGRELKLPLWQFLKDPLIRRFGEEWYGWLSDCAKEFEKMDQG